MKRRHKQVAGGAATIVALAGLLGAADEFMQHRAEDRRAALREGATDSEVFELEVQLCACEGGKWYRGDCRLGP